MTAVALASTEASIFGTIITQPLWVIKTRMLLNTQPNLNDLQNFQFSCRQIQKQEGIRGYATGLNISLLLSFNGVLQMFTYEGPKKLYDSLNIPQTAYSEKNFFCGAISKFAAVLVTYPFTTVRTRAQQNQYIKDDKTKKYQGSLEIIRRTYQWEGLAGFYKGFQINILRGIMQRGIYFYCYELFKDLVSGR